MKAEILITLLSAGVLSGFINFFVIYVNLPFQPPTMRLAAAVTALKDIWWVALIGYVLTGCGGAMLTLTISAIVGGLKGIDDRSHHLLIIFGYALTFGYSTTRILAGITDSILKRIAKLEEKVA